MWPWSSHPRHISYFEVVGDPGQRVSIVSTMLTKNGTMPTSIVHAQIVEENIGGDELRTADYRAFAHIEFAPDDAAAWQALLTPLAQTPA